MRVGNSAVVFVLFAACRSDGEPPASQRAAAGRGDRTAAAASPQRFVGCYILQTAGSPAYRIKLAPGGEVRPIGAGVTEDASGDHWEWSARSDSTFVVSWSGIDSWMEFNVARRDGKWTAERVVRTTSGEERLPARVERVGCPLPGA